MIEIGKQGMEFQTIQEMRIEKGLKNLKQDTSESFWEIARRIRATTFLHNVLVLKHRKKG